MSKQKGCLLGILLTLFLCMILAWYFCCDSKDNQEVVSPEVKAISTGFTLHDPNGTLLCTYPENFNFYTSQFNILQPVSGQVNAGIGTLQSYLNTIGNADTFVDLRGFYDSNEENTSAFTNLGLARANAVKNYFISEGIPSNRVNTHSELRDAVAHDGTIIRDPIQYTLIKQSKEEFIHENAALKALTDRFAVEPLVLYYDTAQSAIHLAPIQRQKIGDISRYLDKVEGSMVQIVGHTANTGNRLNHTQIGLNRADFTKNYLVRNGISSDRILTSSDGSDTPIATNSTVEGRSQNRRCIVTLN